MFIRREGDTFFREQVIPTALERAEEDRHYLQVLLDLADTDERRESVRAAIARIEQELHYMREYPEEYAI